MIEAAIVGLGRWGKNFVESVQDKSERIRYWRVHVFGDKGSAESIGEHELLLHKSNAQPRRLVLDPVDALRMELEAFADAIEDRAEFPVAASDMLATVAAFEAVVKALETGATVEVAEVDSRS